MMNMVLRTFSLCLLSIILALPVQGYAGRVANVVPDAVELAVLKKLYDDLGGSAWTTKTNWPATGSWPATATSSDFGAWFGVTVQNGDIIRIVLPANNVVGVLPADVGNLTALQIFDLRNNALTGGIPTTIGNLGQLQYLYLFNNALTGSIPSSLGNLSSLVGLYLSENQMTGNIPATLGDLENLQFLRLSENALTGEIPPVLGALSHLTLLDLFRNDLSGAIPESLGELTALQTLLLSENRLSGVIPSSLGNLVDLQSLVLNNNNLSGTIPTEIGNMIALRTLNLSINQLTGNIPASLGNLKLVQTVNLGKNSLSGSVPSALGGMSAVKDLYFHKNRLTGNLPATLGNLAFLETLYAYTNQLSGPLPGTFQSLTRLQTLYIYDNRLEGELPAGLFNAWAHIVQINLSENQFAGSFPSVAGRTSLVHIRAERNGFTALPGDIVTLPVLATLNVSDNNLTTLPALANQVNKVNLNLSVQNNRLDFMSLEGLKNAGFKGVTYAPQLPIRDVTTITGVVGSPLIIPGRTRSTNSTTIWEKQQTNGTWVGVNSLNQDASLVTFKRNSYTATDEGIYRWRMTNSVVTEVTLSCEPITVRGALRFAVDNFGYQYKYDGRRRVTHKKVPGGDWVYLVYDVRDRLVMTQNGEQRKTNLWTFNKYDALNRPIMTGVYRHRTAVDQAGMSALISTTNLSETYTGDAVNHGYSNAVFATATFPLDSFDIQQVTYYDQYTFKDTWGNEYAYVPGQVGTQTHGGRQYDQPATAFSRVMGRVTGGKIKTSGSDRYWLQVVNYYDDRERMIQQVADNYKGGTERTTTVYDFSGKVLANRTQHFINTLAWQKTVGVKVDVDNLVRTTGNNNWTTGASSTASIAAGTDGWVEATVTNTTAFRMVGLSQTDASVNYTTIDYAFYMQGKALLIYMKGSPQYTVPGNSRPGDKLRIERKNGYVNFYRNGILVYPTPPLTLACTTSLLADVSIYTSKGTINHIRMSITQGREQNVLQRYTYDHAGRPLQTWHTVNSGPEVLLTENEYNALGQLVTQRLHSEDNGETFLQHKDYRYNIRNWLTRMNQSDLSADNASDPQDYFGMNLEYENAVPSLSNTPQFNGNISAITWNNGLGEGEATQNAYRYTYDAMNRIHSAEYRQKKQTWGLPEHVDDEGTAHATDAFTETGYEYDLQGNLKHLSRFGKDGVPLDELTYDYGAAGSRGNQLLSVTDGGDKHDGFNDRNVVGEDYVYNANGNMTVDRNKQIQGITYNYLDLPVRVVKATGEYLRMIYDANGGKHSQQVFDAANALVKRTDYSGEFVYENDTLKFINHAEGRVVMTGDAPEYQYHLKDHLSNVRVTLTAKKDTTSSLATLEDVHGATERRQFLNYEEAVTLNQELFDHTHRTTDGAGNTTYRSTRLVGGGTNATYGLAKSISVMPGDKVTAEVHAKYVDTNDANIQPWLLSFVTALAAPASAVPGAMVDGGVGVVSGGSAFPYANYLQRVNDTGDGPKAYLNWVLMDRDFHYLDGGFRRVTTEAKETGTDTEHEPLVIEDGVIRITQPGYVYIYLSNENPTPVEVFFDDFEVMHTKSPVIQTHDYYPFGLRTANSYTREDAVPNRTKLFQEQEHIDDLGLDWDAYSYRSHQPDIGRFFAMDPMANAFYYNSPYAFSENKVTSHREMEGLEAFFIHGTISGNSMWSKDFADFIMGELQPYFSPNQTADLGFRWDDYMGGPVNVVVTPVLDWFLGVDGEASRRNWVNNSERDRAVAARMLVGYILKNRKEGQGITLVGHSHGGNVAIQAARILFEKHHITVNIVNFNTPAFNDADDPENPWDNFGIDEMLHFFTDGDWVAGPVAGKSKYEGGLVGSNVKQIELEKPLGGDIFGLSEHMMDNANMKEIVERFTNMMEAQSNLGGEKQKKKPDADYEAGKKHGGLK